MDSPVLSFVLSLSGILITIMLGVIGFFIKKLIAGIDKLKEAFDELRIVVSVQKSKIDTFDKSCGLMHGNINKRLDNHGERIAKNERRIDVLSSKIDN